MAARTKAGSTARLYKDLQRNMYRAANAAMRKTMQYAKETAKETTSFQDRTGELRKSIQAGLTVEASPTWPMVTGALSAGYDQFGYTDPTGRHVSTSVYAPIVELGTTKKNYPIRPNRALALYAQGWAHPVPAVLHPGVRPHPFLWPTMMQITSQQVLGQTLEAALAGLYP